MAALAHRLLWPPVGLMPPPLSHSTWPSGLLCGVLHGTMAGPDASAGPGTESHTPAHAPSLSLRRGALWSCALSLGNPASAPLTHL